jgi:hypothetical protein
MYTLSSTLAGLSLGGSLSNNLMTFEPGTVQTIPLTISCPSVSGDFEDMTVNVKLEIYNGPTWEDRVVFRLYKSKDITIYSKGISYASVIGPDDVVVPFSGSLRLPFRPERHNLVISGAQASTEYKYAISLDSTPTVDLVATPVNPGVHEPNDSYADAKILYKNGPDSPLISYLMVDDIDIWELCVTELESPSNLSASRPTSTSANLSWNPVSGADKYYVYKDGVNLTPYGITPTSLDGINVSGVLNATVRAFSSTLGYSIAMPLIEMAPIPVGSFNNINLSAFRIAKSEITQSLYQTVMGTNPSYFSANADAATCPVEQVTWYDAVEFCNKLSAREDLQNVYTELRHTFRLIPCGNRTR